MIFEEVVAAGSILAASRELSMTQPAVSKAVQELEAQLGGQLFLRGKRGVVLTELGNMVERHARIILGELRYFADDLNATQAGTTGSITVGTLITASGTLLPEALHRLRLVAPDVVVTVRVGSNALFFPELIRGELDLVVGALPLPDDAAAGVEPADGEQLRHVPLYSEGVCVVVGKDSPLAKRKQISLAELHDGDWIVPTRESQAYASVRAFFLRAGLDLPRRRIESVSILTNLALLGGGSMIAVMAQSAAQRFAREGSLVILPMQGLENFGVVGYTLRSNRPPTAATALLLNALQEVAREM